MMQRISVFRASWGVIVVFVHDVLKVLLKSQMHS